MKTEKLLLTLIFCALIFCTMVVFSAASAMAQDPAWTQEAFTASGNFTLPANVTVVDVLLVGGGGGGGCYQGLGGGGGGGGGECG